MICIEEVRFSRARAGIIGIELPQGDFEAVKAQDKQQLQQRVKQADNQLSDLVRMLQQKGYTQTATYISYAQERLFKYVDFWMSTGVAAPRTTSYLERLMREIGRRLKRMCVRLVRSWSSQNGPDYHPSDLQ